MAMIVSSWRHLLQHVDYQWFGLSRGGANRIETHKIARVAGRVKRVKWEGAEEGGKRASLKRRFPLLSVLFFGLTNTNCELDATRAGQVQVLTGLPQA